MTKGTIETTGTTVTRVKIALINVGLTGWREPVKGDTLVLPTPVAFEYTPAPVRWDMMQTHVSIGGAGLAFARGYFMRLWEDEDIDAFEYQLVQGYGYTFYIGGRCER